MRGLCICNHTRPASALIMEPPPSIWKQFNKQGDQQWHKTHLSPSLVVIIPPTEETNAAFKKRRSCSVQWAGQISEWRPLAAGSQEQHRWCDSTTDITSCYEETSLGERGGEYKFKAFAAATEGICDWLEERDGWLLRQLWVGQLASIQSECDWETVKMFIWEKTLVEWPT